jgi:hypothetical protein
MVTINVGDQMAGTEILICRHQSALACPVLAVFADL